MMFGCVTGLKYQRKCLRCKKLFGTTDWKSYTCKLCSGEKKNER